jgi:hypothetical protein
MRSNYLTAALLLVSLRYVPFSANIKMVGLLVGICVRFTLLSGTVFVDLCRLLGLHFATGAVMAFCAYRLYHLAFQRIDPTAVMRHRSTLQGEPVATPSQQQIDRERFLLKENEPYIWLGPVVMVSVSAGLTFSQYQY